MADTAVTDYEENRAEVTAIAEKLKETGWNIACAGYSHSYMDAMSLEDCSRRLKAGRREVGTLVGGSDILFYPYGAEVEYPSEQLDYLTESGFVYLCGLWGDTDYMEIQENYMRQTRRVCGRIHPGIRAGLFYRIFQRGKHPGSGPVKTGR